MKISEAKEKFVFTTRIDLNDDGSEYIVLKEPNSKVVTEIGEDGVKNFEIMTKAFPDCVVESSITNDDGTPADAKAIVNVLKESGTLFTFVIGAWIQSIPFQSRLAKVTKSDK